MVTSAETSNTGSVFMHQEEFGSFVDCASVWTQIVPSRHVSAAVSRAERSTQNRCARHGLLTRKDARRHALSALVACERINTKERLPA
ncbi:MAG TPA: hypothetical protein DCQ94_14805 [Nitrospira sp.]|nr:hypothetical protein [Nitrospira sp.]